MMYGVVDVGSNTIRLCIYDVDEGQIKQLLNHKTTAGLIGYVKNRLMGQRGIAKVCEVLHMYKKIAEEIQVSNLFVFATAPLRNIDNTREVVGAILKNTGIRVEVLSGEEEAMMGFYGAVHADRLDEGLLVDIGGGSTELLVYREEEIQASISLPFGSLSLFNRYVSDLFPSRREEKEICKEVTETLKKCRFQKGETFSVFEGVGGSIRAAQKLNRELTNGGSPDNVLLTEDLHILLQKLKEDKKYTMRKILRAAPERIHTLIPGMIILNAICNYYDCKKVQISSFGVREGYLYKKAVLQR